MSFGFGFGDMERGEHGGELGDHGERVAGDFLGDLEGFLNGGLVRAVGEAVDAVVLEGDGGAEPVVQVGGFGRPDAGHGGVEFLHGVGEERLAIFQRGFLHRHVELEAGDLFHRLSDFLDGDGHGGLEEILRVLSGGGVLLRRLVQAVLAGRGEIRSCAERFYHLLRVHEIRLPLRGRRICSLRGRGGRGRRVFVRF